MTGGGAVGTENRNRRARSALVVDPGDDLTITAAPGSGRCRGSVPVQCAGRARRLGL